MIHSVSYLFSKESPRQGYVAIFKIPEVARPLDQTPGGNLCE